MMEQRDTALLQRAAWPATLTVVTVLSTLALACATPFPALATLAALFLPRRTAFILVGANWLANQALGFGLLNYPLTWDCVRGGLELGVASLACTGAALIVQAALRRYGSTLTVMASFVAAFVTSEALLVALGGWRFSGDWSPPVLVYVLSLNGIALAGLLLLQGIATTIGLARPVSGLLSVRVRVAN